MADRSVQWTKRLQLKSFDSQKMVKPKGALRMPAEDIGKPAAIAKWKQASKCQCASSTWGLDKLKNRYSLIFFCF